MNTLATTQTTSSLLSGHISGDIQIASAREDGAAVTGANSGRISKETTLQVMAKRRGAVSTSTPSSRPNTSADGGANAVTAPSSTSPRRRRASSPPIDPDTAAALLLYYADIVGDLEQARMAAAGRLRALVAPPPWGKGINAALPEVVVAQAGLAETKALEEVMTARLRKSMAAHPLGPWVNATLGLGEKSMARWLAAVGDLAARETPAQLWAYCGLHVLHPDADGNAGGQDSDGTHLSTAPGIAPRRTRGVKANWSTDAKTRLYVVAEGCVKHRASPYRAVYDAARERYADAVHAYPCAQCKSAAGEPLKDGHKHARAMRALMKRIALHAWREARIAAGLPHNKNRKARRP